MFLNNSAKEALIGLVNWYDDVNSRGNVTIDDLSRLKMFADFARNVLETNKELTDTEKQGTNDRQHTFNFHDPFCNDYAGEWAPANCETLSDFPPFDDDDIPF
jgi:hypothetical protein